jgi:hypothetical protein
VATKIVLTSFSFSKRKRHSWFLSISSAAKSSKNGKCMCDLFDPNTKKDSFLQMRCAMSVIEIRLFRCPGDISVWDHPSSTRFVKFPESSLIVVSGDGLMSRQWDVRVEEEEVRSRIRSMTGCLRAGF